ncbi:hypothetical protein O181_036169 [Austropuccinia psidii MF-1]|uniref:Uncharacterized protein n=1 Tax=Austropuccinia psidii MF-1 TaxID=1389203 RepID=A0A9Q3D455_9BASI|nr:hypothetical protein [Austropuccinia psidii MF-1]
MLFINAFAVALSFSLGPATLAVLSGFHPNNLPYHSEPRGGQTGYNQCGTKAKKDSKCQNLFIKSAEDFCIFAPPTRMKVGDAERDCVAYCTKSGYGTRLIPPKTFQNLHYVRTPHYIQLVALGDFTKVNVEPNDQGGELDPSGADGRGNPIGGLVFGDQGQQFDHWTEFLSYDEICLRACFNGPEASRYCEHIYDEMGCRWNMPARYDVAGFYECEGDDVPLPMGEYRRPDGSIYKWHQGQQPTPGPGAPGKINKCKYVKTPGAYYPSMKRATISEKIEFD